MNRLTIEEINNRMIVSGKSIKVIDTEYSNKDTPLKCLCLLCGKEFYMTYSTMRNSDACQECGYEKGRLKRSFSIDQIKEKLFELNPTIELMSEEYKNSKTRLHYKCKVCGNEWDRTFDKMRESPECHICKIANKEPAFTIDEIKHRLSLISPDIEILSTEYHNNTEKLRCRCLIDGYEWDVSWQSLQMGHGCHQCKWNKIKELKIFTLEEVKTKIHNIHSNIVVTSTEYLGANEPLNCKCTIDGNEWTTTYASISQGTNCPKCSINSLKNTIEEITARLKILQPHIELESREYINASSKLDFHCTIDDHRWSMPWESVTKKRGCPKCAIRNRSGKFHVNWKGGITPLQAHLRMSIMPWKRDSKKYCNYKCVITGERFDIVHHLYGFDLILDETMRLENLPVYENITDYTADEMKRLEKRCLDLHYKYGFGVCLTKDMHKKFHAIYNYGKNTPEQFEEFLRISDVL